MIVEITMIVEIGIPVVVCPVILNMLVEPMTKIPAMTKTMVFQIPTRT